MRIKHKNRVYKVLFFLLVLASASWLIFSSLSENLLYFYTPSQWKEKQTELMHQSGQKIKLGGLVQTGSIRQHENSLKVEFEITDLKEKIQVQYEGILPDLFREMQGVIVDGVFDGETFIATSVLAKHDENYMPAELAKELGYTQMKSQSRDPAHQTFNLNEVKPQSSY